MIVESPPLGERWPATFGFLAMMGQHIALAMIIGGAAELERPIDWTVSAVATNDGAWLMGHGAL